MTETPGVRFEPEHPVQPAGRGFDGPSPIDEPDVLTLTDIDPLWRDESPESPE